MAYTLNTGHALYGNLIELIGVQAGALVSHKVARTFTVVSGASFATGGTYGEAFHSVENSYSPKNATFSPAITVDTNTNTNTTVFVVINSAGAVTGNGHLICGTAGPGIGVNSTDIIALLGFSGAAAGYAADATDSAPHSIAMTRASESSHEVYLDAVSVGSGGGLGYNTPSSYLSEIGGAAGHSSITADIVWIAVFNKILNSTEISDLHASLGASNAFALVSSGDSTAPTLTSASVTSVGATTATGNVTTDEGNGTLYSIVSTSATAPNAAQIQAGNDHTGSAAVWASGPITVSSTGAKTTSITGLTASTAYYAHFQHKDAANNNSTVVSSAQFTTLTPDSTNPTMTGSVTVSAKTTTSYTASWSAASDNVAVTGYEYRLNAGSWVDLGAVLTVNISARTPGATDTFEVRAYDAAGNRATALSQSITLYIGTITIPAVKDWGTGNLKTGETGVQVDIHNISTGALVVRKTGQTTHATTGVCVVQDASIADATTYEVVTRFADGSKGMWDYTASLT